MRPIAFSRYSLWLSLARSHIYFRAHSWNYHFPNPFSKMFWQQKERKKGENFVHTCLRLKDSGFPAWKIHDKFWDAHLCWPTFFPSKSQSDLKLEKNSKITNWCMIISKDKMLFSETVICLLWRDLRLRGLKNEEISKTIHFSLKLVVEQVPKIWFSGTWYQLKNGFMTSWIWLFSFFAQF